MRRPESGAAPALSPATHRAEDVVRLLGLAPLPHEGGWFRRLATGAAGGSSYSLIHALFTPTQFSALHRLAVPEVWCFQGGDPLELLQLRPDGGGETVTLGLELGAGSSLHAVIPPGNWQGARTRAGGRWSLVACVVVPEFEWAHFTLGEREPLRQQYPNFAAEVTALTRVTTSSPPVA